MILVRTSAWIEYFRGTGSTAAIEVRRRLVNGLPFLGVDSAVDFRAAADIYRAARRTGATIRSINDCLIAAIAIRHSAPVVHRAADFDVIARITSLEAASIR